MSAKTLTSPRHKYILYLTKHLRLDLHDRLRMQATIRGTTIEDMVNVVLEVGLPVVEKVTSDARKAKRKTFGAVMEEEQI